MIFDKLNRKIRFEKIVFKIQLKKKQPFIPKEYLIVTTLISTTKTKT